MKRIGERAIPEVKEQWAGTAGLVVPIRRGVVAV
jgi:hypothetical protein